mgnify:CR=1 FL=1
MLNIFYLIAIIMGLAVQNIVKKPYTDRTEGRGVYLFNTLLSFSALLFFVGTSKNLHFNWSIIPYAFGFSFTYILASVFSVKAISCGSLSLTSLILSYSLMLPTFYGILFLQESMSVGFLIGIVLLVISLLLINKKGDSGNITWKWLLFVFLSFVGNGLCTVVQKMQQVSSKGEFKNEFMIVSLFIVALAMLVFTLKYERTEASQYVRYGWHFALLCGIMNGVVNLFVMILSARMPVALMFPLISAGGIIITYLVSKFFYKEKLAAMQLTGFLIGIVSVVFLNL